MAPTTENGGETMVAIIQSLKDAGLAVTLMNAPRGYFSQKPRSRRAPVYRSSVETNTEWPRCSHAAQICDSHYASSYQLAHCRLKPTSPAPDLPEFPAQRGTPSRTRGNFRVGRSESKESPYTRPKYGRSRGSFSRSPCDSACDSFMDSLRKYPLSVGRSASSELVQRLFNYTHAKHASKNTRNKRSSFSPKNSFSPKHSHKKCNKNAKIAVNKSTNKSSKTERVSKNVQTYTRMVNQVREKEMEKVKAKRCKKSVSVDAMLSPNLTDQYTESYDYLKAGRKQRPSEVRYLSDVRRVIKDTIKQMVDVSTPVPCNNARCRYKEHRKLHHRSDSSTSPLQNESEARHNDSHYNENYVYMKRSSCDRSSCTKQQQKSTAISQCSELCIDEVRKYIRQTIKTMVDCNPTCSKKLPICKVKRFLSSTQIQEEEEEEEVIKEENKEDIDSDTDTDVEAENECADVCPGPKSAVCPNVLNRYRQHRKKYHEEEAPTDDDNDTENEDTNETKPELCYPPPRTKRSSFFSLRKPCICDDEKKKSDALDLVYADDDEYASEGLDIDIEEQVMEWTTRLPAYTGNTEENKGTILEMAHDLIDKLNAVKGRPDYDERALEKIQEFLDQLPYPVKEETRIETRKEREKSKDEKEEVPTGDIDLDELRDIVSRWLDCLNLKPNDDSSKEDIIEQFVSQLEPMIETNETPESFKSKVLTLVKKTKYDVPGEDLDELANDLASELEYLALRRHEQKLQRIRNKFLNPILDWLMDNEDVPQELKEKHRKPASDTDAKLRKMVVAGAGEEALTGEIDDFFKSMPQDSLQISPKKKSRLSQLFIKDVKSGLSPMNTEEKEQLAQDLLQNIKPRPFKRENKQPVLDWLENNPHIDEENKENNKKLAKQFDKKLQQMMSENVDNDVIENEINEFLDALSENGIPIITPDQKAALTKTIHNKIKSGPIETKKKPQGQPISNWLKNAPNIPKQVKENNKIAFDNFEKKIQEMKEQKIDKNVIQDEINDFLDSLPEKGINVTPSEKNKLATNMLKGEATSSTLKNIQPTTEWLDNAPNIPVQIKEKTKKLAQNFDEKLQNMKARSVEDDVIEDEINEFLDTLATKGVPFSPKQKSEIAKNIFKDVMSTPAKTQSTTHLASRWLENAPNIPKPVKEKNKKVFDNFERKIQEMKDNNIDEEIIQDKINDFLDSLPATGIKISPAEKNTLTKNMLKELNSTETKSQLMQIASDWLENAPDIPKKVKEKNRKVFNNFEKKIQEMRDNNVDKETIQDEINEFMDSLPEKGINVSPAEKNTLAKSILKEPDSASKKSQLSKQTASNWLENAPNIPKQVKEKNRKVFDNFEKKIQEMKDNNVDEETIQDEINEFINSLPEKGIKVSPAEKKTLAKSILKEPNSAPKKSQLSKQTASNWLENASNIPKQIKDKNNKVFDNFERKIQEMKDKNVDEETIKDEINDFLDSLPGKGIKVSPAEKKTLTENMLQELLTKSQPTKQIASEWLENAPNVPKQVKEKNKKVFDNFEKKIQEMKDNNVDEDTIQDEINEFMESLPEKGIKVSPAEKKTLTKSILKEPKSTPKISQLSEQTASNWLENASNIPKQVKEKNKKVFDNFEKKIQDMKDNNVDEETIQDEINEFMDSLPKKGITLTPKQKNELAGNILKQSSDTSEVHKRPATDWGMSTPNQTVSDWLQNAPNVSKQAADKNRNLINNFDKKIEQMRAKGVGGDVIKKEINQFVNSLSEKGIKLSPTQKDELANDILQQDSKSTKRFSLTPKPKSDLTRNDLESNQFGDSSTPDRCEITGNIRPASEWLESSTDISKETKLKNKKFVKKFDEKLKKLKSENASNYRIENQIKHFLEDLPEQGILVSPKEKDRLKKSLLDVIKESSDQRVTSNTVRPVSQWMDSSMDIPERVKGKTHDVVESFDDRLYRLRAGNATEEEIEKEIKEFLGALQSQGIGMTPAEKAQLLKKFLNESKMMINTLSRPSVDSSNITDQIKTQNPAVMKNFNKMLAGLPANLDDDDMEDAIRKYVDSLAAQGIYLTPEEKERMVQDLMKDAKGKYSTPEEEDKMGQDLMKDAKEKYSTPEEEDKMGQDLMKDAKLKQLKRPSLIADFQPDMTQPELKRAVKDEVNNILGKYDIPPEYADEVEKNISDALADALLRGVSDSELENTLMDILRNANVSEEEAKKIIADMMNKKKQMAAATIPEAATDFATSTPHKKGGRFSGSRLSGLSYVDSGVALTESEIKEAVKDEVSNILGKYVIPPEYAEEVEKNISNALADALLQGLSDSELEKNLMDILKNANVSEEEAKRIIADLMKKKQQMATTTKVPDSKSAKLYSLSPKEKEQFKNIVNDKILDFIADKTGDKSPESRNERALTTIPLSSKLTDIMTDPKDKNRDQHMLDQINKYLEDEPINSDIPKKELANQLKDILNGIDFGRRNSIQNAKLQDDIDKTLKKWLDETKSLARTDKNKLKDKTPKLAENIKKHMQSGDNANLLDSIYDALSPWVRSINKDIDDSELLNMAKEIESALNKQGVTESSFMFPQSSKMGLQRLTSQEQLARLLKAPDKFVKDAVDKWEKTLTMPATNKNMTEKAKNDVVNALTDAFVSHGGKIPPDKENKIFQDVVAQFLDDVPEHPYSPADVNTLADSLKGMFYESAQKYAQGRTEGSVSKKGADILLDDITNWVESLPIEANTPEEKENADKQKQDIKSKLIHKIGELNMNPEIFNDDFLYEDMLEDEVDKLLLNTGSENVKKQLPKLKKSFLDLVRKARQKIRDENAGQVYKQQLKDAISRTLPSFQFTSPEGRASFDVLKDEITDDFINMHYVANNPCEINRLKDRINGGVYDFCMKNLKRCPAKPLDTSQLNESLYRALESIPVPLNESFKDEVELVKLKDVVNDWVRDLPLQYQSGLKKLHTNKMVSVLAKKLHDIENEHDDKIKKETVHFLNKLPLSTNRDEELDQFAEDLIHWLRDTEELRKLNASRRHCIDTRTCFRPCTVQPPPCTLSQEDLDHLERIKQRNKVKRKISFKDVCLSPCSVDTATQTECRSPMEPYVEPGICLGRKNSSAQTLCRRVQAVGSQVCPNVIVNDHHWHSTESDIPTEQSMTICGAPTPRRTSGTPSKRRIRSPSRPCQSEYTSQQSQMPLNSPRYSQTRPPDLKHRPSSYQEQNTSSEHQNQAQTPARAQIPSRPTPHTPLASQPWMQCPAEPCIESRGDSFLSEPCQTVTEQRRSATVCQSPRATCPPPAQRNVRGSGFTVCNPCPESSGSERRLQGNRINRRAGPDPCMTSSCQSPGPSYQTTQSSELLSSDQPCYGRQHFISSSPMSSDDFERGCFQNRVTRVTHLGSFDHPEQFMPRMPNYNPDMEYWDTEYRSSPSDRNDDARKHCRCKPKCGKYKGKRRPCHLANDEAMNSCAKCRGVHCPFPSYMFFR